MDRRTFLAGVAAIAAASSSGPLAAQAPRKAAPAAGKTKHDAEREDLFDGPIDERGPRLDKTAKAKWQVGVIIRSIGGQCRGIFSTIPVPTAWPEQEVRIAGEEFTPHVARVGYRNLDHSIKQMIVNIPLLPAGDTAKALVTFEVTRRSMLPPADTSIYQWPEKPEKEVMNYLGPSPFIEVRAPQIRDLAKEILKDKEGASAWEKVEAIYDAVRAKVEYVNGKLKGALAALKDGKGDCEELTSLFVAVCRASGVPARSVWIPDHTYPEFYLQTADGKGHWFPCQAAGTREFGGTSDFRPILQKGDNIKVPEKKEPQRYAAEFLKGLPSPGGGQPQVEFVRLQAAAD